MYSVYQENQKEKLKKQLNNSNTKKGSKSNSKRSTTIDHGKAGGMGGKLTSDDFLAIRNAKINRGSNINLHTNFAKLLVTLNETKNRNPQGVQLIQSNTATKSKKSGRKRGKTPGIFIC